ncbi:IclR family transcriptional regulator [Agrobacterium vitis]|uniref:IclR family transcriptional regulator n=1 Tax=Agrobacterium vitis TaxID=373 RepID=A0AAE4WET0_AGRVI|nr:IclR family transcriptional regulator C-terminal domain-containing protein [Agrobacterium vitis]MCF1499880.1 IclR family transcriptional regulator [Allorhizobium sp. Av2]MBF2714562.1 IclR family transcriptional regulator [Agrobacterium vitis]MCM2442907.1 IclR family transcriptional regulator [Agrobacterium vitis]MUZ58845.1 IclR family transcriptional regulator [Agrobacterium vitis]MUZ64524.1 IclR family transcriptional regulator [Agrobacterium vitis]
MSSLTKMLLILDLFSVDRPIWSADEIIQYCGHSRPTGYRYVKELCDAGLLRRAEGGYSLGPRVIELDYYIRQCDPLLIACRPVMVRVAQESGCDVLLASMYGTKIMAVHQELAHETGQIAFGRGRPMPLFRGGGSKVLLASMTASQLKKLYDLYGAEIAEAGLGATWPEFRKQMLKYRNDGHVVSIGELDPNAAGIAVPVPVGDALDPAALVILTTRSRFDLMEKALLIDMAMNAARQIETSMRGNREVQAKALLLS